MLITNLYSSLINPIKYIFIEDNTIIYNIYIIRNYLRDNNTLIN